MRYLGGQAEEHKPHLMHRSSFTPFSGISPTGQALLHKQQLIHAEDGFFILKKLIFPSTLKIAPKGQNQRHQGRSIKRENSSVRANINMERGKTSPVQK